MPPRGERMMPMEEAEPIPLVRKKETKEAIEAILGPSEDVVEALSGVFSMQTERERAETAMSPEEADTMLAYMDQIVSQVESVSAEVRQAEQEEKDFKTLLDTAKGLHEVAESINTAEQLTFEAAMESQKAPEVIGFEMRRTASHDAMRSYETIAVQIANLLTNSKDLPLEFRRKLVAEGQRLEGLIRHEQQIEQLAERNIHDWIAASLTAEQRKAA